MAKSEYIANPLDMIKPSAKALMVNLDAMVRMLLVIVASVTVTVGGSVAWWMLKSGGGSQLAATISLLLGIFGVITLIALSLVIAPATNILYVASAQGQKRKLGDFLQAARPFIVRNLVLSILFVLAVLGGLLLFIIPGLIFIAWFSLSGYAMVTEDLGAIASMKRSKELVSGRVLETWGLMSVSNAANIIPVVGSLVSFGLGIVMMPALAMRYLQLKDTKPADRPAVNWISYALIVLAILGGSMAAKYNANNTKSINTNPYNYSY